MGAAVVTFFRFAQVLCVREESQSCSSSRIVVACWCLLCFGFEKNFFVLFCLKTVAFLLSGKKKKRSHFTFKEEESDKRHAHVFCCCRCLYSGGEDESAEKADGRERCVGFDRE